MDLSQLTAAVIIALPGIVAALQSWRNGRKTAEVHTLVNSQKAEMVKKIAELTLQTEEMVKEIASLKTLLAESKAKEKT